MVLPLQLSQSLPKFMSLLLVCPLTASFDSSVQSLQCSNLELLV